MLTIQALAAFGADTQDGLRRCMDNESFYLTMVKTLKKDTHVEQLSAALKAEDWGAAFEAAHALKGVFANLSLTPLTTPVSKLTELLRPRQKAPYADLLAEIQDRWSQLQALLAD